MKGNQVAALEAVREIGKRCPCLTRTRKRGHPSIYMTRAVHALLLALGDLTHRRVLRVLILSMGLTIALFAAVGVAAYSGLAHALASNRWIAAQGIDIAAILTLLGLVIGGWLLFRAAAIMVVGLFADAIVADVEERHYPGTAAGAVRVGLGRSMQLALASLARLIVGNLLALPFYIALLITGIGTPILALIVNGVLLGRDLEAMALARHPGLPTLDRSARWSLGLLSAATFLVPVANFLAPVLGAAMAVHMVHLRKNSP